MPGLLNRDPLRGLLYQQPQGALAPQPQGLLGAPSPFLGGITMGGTGIAPYGLRHSGEAPKGRGFFGALPHQGGGYSTELSSEFEHEGKTVEHPLMVPALTAQELQQLLSGAQPTQSIHDKARAYALMRLQQGLSPFAGPTEMRYPVPK